MIARSLLLVVGVWAVGSNSTQAEDWPEFRGPTGQGHSSTLGLPLEWDTSRNVVWKQTVAGIGWSSPVVVDGRVFLTTSVATSANRRGNQSLQTVCIDAQTGRVLWSTEVFEQDGDTAPRIHQKNSHASPTPLVRNGRVYVHFGHQGTACLDIDGQIIWRQQKLEYQPVHGNGGSPILVGDLLVFSCDGRQQQFVAALDCQSGTVRWKTNRNTTPQKGFSFTTPLLISVGGEPQIVSPASDAVMAYEPTNGKEIWRVRYAGGYSLVPRPVAGHGMVYVCTGYNRPRLLAIRTDGKGDVTDTHVEWSTSRAVPHNPSPVLVGNELYMVSDRGVASCLDARTGTVHWQERLGGNYSASPLHADGHIYFQDESGRSTVVQAGKVFTKLANNDLAERTFASYAVSDGSLFLRTESQLYRIEGK